MTEKDIKIEGEETVDAVDTENTENAEQTEATGAENEKSADKESEAEEKDPLVKAQEEIDKWLRSVAEFENYRKRTLKERAELILNGGEKVITAILPILDDMERAIENGAKTDDPEVLRYRCSRGCGHGAWYGRRQERQGHRLSAGGL